MSPIGESGPTRPFDNRKAVLQLGQWVDVKDTIDQWLEAQVTRLRPGQVFVHYNGWGNHWDEWIDIESPRIAAFRTYTLQYPSSRYQSPAPNILPDAENHEISARSAPPLNSLIRQASALVTNLQKYIELYTEFVGEEQKLSMEEAVWGEEGRVEAVSRGKKQLAAQLAPLLDRTGRLLCDIGPHFAHMANPETFRDEEGYQPLNYEGEHPDIDHQSQVPLIANSGDVAVISNLLDRVIFGDAPSLEVHVHAFLTQPAQPPLPRPHSEDPLDRPSFEPVPPLLPSLQQQQQTNCDTETQTEDVSVCDAGTSTDFVVTHSSIGVQAVEEVKSRVAPKKEVKSPLRQKIKAHVGHTIIRESPKVGKGKCMGNDFRITKTNLKMGGSTVRRPDHKLK